jgi:hypothetical protein
MEDASPFEKKKVDLFNFLNVALTDLLYGISG